MASNIELIEHFYRLQREQENYLQTCCQKIENWKRFKDDYITLKNRLETLPHELRYEITVPISKMAFMPGKLVNTNEILVLLGDNWFVEKSSKQACDLIDRRLINIEKHLDDLSKEKKVINDQLEWTINLMKEKGEYVNIEEKLEDNQDLKANRAKQISEKEKLEIRKKLQEKALRTAIELENEIKQEMSSLYKKKPEEQIDEFEEDEYEEEEEEEDDIVEKNKEKNLNFIKKLEEDIKHLDLEPKFPDIVNEPIDQEQETYLKQMIKDYDRNIDRQNNEIIKQKFKDNIKKNGEKIKKKVKWSDTDQGEDIFENKDDNLYSDEYSSEEEEEDDDDDDYDQDYESDLVEKDLVKQDEAKSIIIKIKHTKNDLIDELERNLKLSRDRQDINSPGDVYNFFYKPKSILKKTSDTDLSVVKELSLNEETNKKNKIVLNSEAEKFEPHKAFTGEIVERNVVVRQDLNSNEDKSNEIFEKPVSKFKASKFSQNK